MMPGLIIGTCPTPNLGCVDPVITITQMYKTNAFSLKNSIFQNNVRHHEMLAPPPTHLHIWNVFLPAWRCKMLYPIIPPLPRSLPARVRLGLWDIGFGLRVTGTGGGWITNHYCVGTWCRNTEVRNPFRCLGVIGQRPGWVGSCTLIMVLSQYSDNIKITKII